MLLPARLFLLAALLVAGGCGSSAETQAVSSDPRPAPRNAAPSLDLSDLERRVLASVNRLRLDRGQDALSTDTSLAALARAHSLDMRDRNFVAHRNPDGLRAGERARRAGYAYRELGENLFRGRLYDTISRIRRGDEEQTLYLWYTSDELADLVAAMWLESPSHRENMLAARYHYGGVGVAVGADYEVFVTLNLSAL